MYAYFALCRWNFFLLVFLHFLLSVNKYFFPQKHLFPDFKCGFVEVFSCSGGLNNIFFCVTVKQMGFIFHVLVAKMFCWNNVETFFKVFYIFFNNNYSIISYNNLCGKYTNLYIYPYTTCHISIRQWNHNKWWDHSLVCCLKKGVYCACKLQ